MPSSNGQNPHNRKAQKTRRILRRWDRPASRIQFGMVIGSPPCDNGILQRNRFVFQLYEIEVSLREANKKDTELVRTENDRLREMLAEKEEEVLEMKKFIEQEKNRRLEAEKCLKDMQNDIKVRIGWCNDIASDVSFLFPIVCSVPCRMLIL